MTGNISAVVLGTGTGSGTIGRIGGGPSIVSFKRIHKEIALSMSLYNEALIRYFFDFRCANSLVNISLSSDNQSR